ncbi:PaaX family transcriptional regulator C-terminal domain-containing protein [Streptomyces sp. NPDC047042]|uniref:PaaX family transcriptional regulator C-terminal domain-containing protein n=1 Tax=Streptomyces sp. NPDC047042 TaxID=3154807 RepID=UPI00340D32EC
MLDPKVPAELMPSRWTRAEARELFATLYDGLAGPACEHVRRSCTDGDDVAVSGIDVFSVNSLPFGTPG